MKTEQGIFFYFSSVSLFGYLNVSLCWCLKPSKESVQEEKTRKETDGLAALPGAWKGLDHTRPDPSKLPSHNNQYSAAEFGREACGGKASRITKRGLEGCLLPESPPPPTPSRGTPSCPPHLPKSTQHQARPKPQPSLAISFVLLHADHLLSGAA